MPKSLDIDQDNMHMKFSALNVDFSSVSFDPLGSRSPPYERIKFGYRRQSARFLLLSTLLLLLLLLKDKGQKPLTCHKTVRY